MKAPTQGCRALRLHKIALGLSDESLADVLEVDPKTVSRWLRGSTTPRCSDLARIEERMGISARSWGEPPWTSGSR
mgnify:CR=1 FL=1